MKTKALSVHEVEYVAYRMAKELMEWDEPIPAFGVRFPNILESCLLQPFSTFGRKNLYRGFVEKGAILFYLLIKNHPFENGNKRIAIATLIYFLYKNEKWLKLSNQNLYLFAKEVAASDSKKQHEVQEDIKRFLRAYTISSHA